MDFYDDYSNYDPCQDPYFNNHPIGESYPPHRMFVKIEHYSKYSWCWNVQQHKRVNDDDDIVFDKICIFAGPFNVKIQILPREENIDNDDSD